MKEYYRIIYEKVKAEQIKKDVDIPYFSGSSNKRHFPKGSFLVEFKNGERTIMLENVFERNFKHIQENKIDKELED